MGKYILMSLLLVSLSLVNTTYANKNHTESTAEYLKNTKITTVIKSKLIANSDINSNNISVKTVNGIVTLTGHVENEAQKAKVEADVKSVEGVKSVENHLKIQSENSSNGNSTNKHHSVD